MAQFDKLFTSREKLVKAVLDLYERVAKLEAQASSSNEKPALRATDN